MSPKISDDTPQFSVNQLNAILADKRKDDKQLIAKLMLLLWYFVKREGNRTAIPVDALPSDNNRRFVDIQVKNDTVVLTCDIEFAAQNKNEQQGESS